MFILLKCFHQTTARLAVFSVFSIFIMLCLVDWWMIVMEFPLLSVACMQRYFYHEQNMNLSTYFDKQQKKTQMNVFGKKMSCSNWSPWWINNRILSGLIWFTSQTKLQQLKQILYVCEDTSGGLYTKLIYYPQTDPQFRHITKL